MLAQLAALLVAASAWAAGGSDLNDQKTPPPPTVADPINGLALWNGARIGMTVSDVRSLFPAAAAPTSPTTLTGGEVEALELDHVDLGPQQGSAQFFFKSGALVAVELLPAHLPARQSRENLLFVQELVRRYAVLYGEGYDCGDRSVARINAYSCKWLAGRLSVRLWYMDVAGQAPLLYIAYRQADDPGYDL